MEPLVSVIIPVYNVRPYIHEALDSVINQTYHNIEIIIIDDESTDGSGAVCDDYARKDNRIIVKHQENKGLSTTRNIGLDIATGQMITFLDPDDAYHPMMIEILAGEMKKQQADIAVCCFSIQKTQEKMLFTENNDQTVQFRNISKNEALLKVYNREINMAPWNKIYTREIWEGLRFPKGHVCEGTYCIFDIFDRAKHVLLTDAELVAHRNRQNSIFNTESINYIYDYEIARNHYLSYVIEHTPTVFSKRQETKLKRERLHEAIAIYLHYYVDNTNTDETQQLFYDELIRAGEAINITCCNFVMKAEYDGVILFPGFCHYLFNLYKKAKMIMLKSRKRKISSESI